MVKNIVKKIIAQYKLEKTYLREAKFFWLLTRKFNASNRTDEDIEKMQYTLLRENHTIEKGMSLRNPHKGFGQQKVLHLLNRLCVYFTKYYAVDADFLRYPLSTIHNYISYSKENGVPISEIEEKYNYLLKKTHNEGLISNAGVYMETKQHILSCCNTDFESLVFSRHSIRYFNKERPDRLKIEKALKLAQQTPSACNRQGWKVHVYGEELSGELLKWQGGCRGFEKEIPCTLLITANLKAFLSYEVHQAYVDGGLYAMNLINALHSLGLGTIPLSTAFDYYKQAALKNFGVPLNEVPILIIGVGGMPDSFKVAVSERKSIEKTTIWHEMIN